MIPSQNMIYFWDPYENVLQEINLETEKIGACNPFIFVRNGYFKEAYENITKLNTEMKNILNSGIEKRDELKSILKKY